ncbi:MAG TPA: 1,4-alpha-glucan branching protein GlgB [Elusimicrobiota bacterium]|nr:1,4-alpha-glucan branching protein GlgB [Elusimicrobiota bacterium]
MKVDHPGENHLSAQDLYLFNEGKHFKLHEKLGAHLGELDGKPGVFFAVWAPNARKVCVMGDFNEWSKTKTLLHPQGSSGIWAGFVPEATAGSLYKYWISSNHGGAKAEKIDPFAFAFEEPPRTACVVAPLDYSWGDGPWMAERARKNSLASPMSVYEVHLGSWRRKPEDGGRFLTYQELATQLAQHAREMGFTHVELMPVMEHPFSGSWGYQSLGYFAPTSRHGSPRDFMHFVDVLHQNGIGVILDWVPSHFATDPHGLGLYDGTALYEHADPKQGVHPDWGSYVFNYGRNEVRSFLISSALYWLEKYHVDGLRVDAVASMLYLDYSRKAGDWVPNRFGGRENLDAIEFMKTLNTEIYSRHPDVQTFAEESTSWPAVSRPAYVGGLGFGMKWDMGWMHDTLSYFAVDPLFRKYHHDRLTFRMLYAFHENFILPLSHDEVTHGKGSLYGKMSGADEWQKCANLRLLLGYMHAQAGKKLLFMGSEFAQWSEWNHDKSLDWHEAGFAPHAGVQRWLADLNRLYAAEPALHALDCDPAGFEWIDCGDADHNVISLLRKDGRGRAAVGVFNFSPEPQHGYRVGVPRGGRWKEALNSDAKDYWGSGQGNFGGIPADEIAWHGRPFSLQATLPPLSAVFFVPEEQTPMA